MSKRTMVFLIFAGLALLGAWSADGAWLTGRSTALTHGDHADATPAPAPDDPFMGVADASAPYDLRFIDEMIMHHQGAIISAEMMIGDSERPELRDLARRIQQSQREQIERMRAWREQWYPDTTAPAMDMDPMGGMMDMMGGNGGMMDGMMADMMGGEQANRMFLRMMIPHHQLAIDMAEDALRQAEHEDLKGLAREIVADQSAEITEMEGYLRDWYGEDSTRDAAGAMRDMMRMMMGGDMMGGASDDQPMPSMAGTPTPAAAD